MKINVAASAGISLLAFWFVLAVTLIWGWVLNILSLIEVGKSGFSGNEVEVILRVVGIFVAILGSIFGFFWN